MSMMIFHFKWLVEIKKVPFMMNLITSFSRKKIIIIILNNRKPYTREKKKLKIDILFPLIFKL